MKGPSRPSAGHRAGPGYRSSRSDGAATASGDPPGVGVAPSISDRAADLTEKLASIREARARVDKLAEILAETEAFIEDEREDEIGLIVSSVRRAATRKDPTVVALFEETIRYHGQLAARAHKTRLKNQQAAPAETPAPAATPPAPSPQ